MHCHVLLRYNTLQCHHDPPLCLGLMTEFNFQVCLKTLLQIDKKKYFQIHNDTMTQSFDHLGIQCVKKKDIEDALRIREEIRVDPFKSKLFQVLLSRLTVCNRIQWLPLSYKINYGNLRNF